MESISCRLAVFINYYYWCRIHKGYQESPNKHKLNQDYLTIKYDPTCNVQKLCTTSTHS